MIAASIVIMLLVCSVQTYADDSRELTPPENLFLREVTPYAAAAALTLNGADSYDYLHTEEGMWEAVAWYTVFKGYDYITLYEVRGVQEAMWPNGTFFSAPQYMIDSGDIIAVNRGGNIGMSYEFPVHKMLYGNKKLDVGYRASVQYDFDTRYAVKAFVEEKFGDYRNVNEFTIYVKPWNVKASHVVKRYRAAYTVRNADLPKPAMQYTAEDIQEANAAAKLLKKYETLKVTNSSDFNPDMTYISSYYSQDGAPAFMTIEKSASEGVTSVYGYYRGFSYYTEDGRTVAHSGLEEEFAYENDMYIEYFYGDPILLDMDANLMTVGFLDASIYGVQYDIYKLNKDLEVISHTWKYFEAEYDYDDDGYLIYPEDDSRIEYSEYNGKTTYNYGARVDDSSVRAAWTAGVKTVTVNIETFENGERHVDIYKVRVPKTWEYLPYEYYQYNCWMNEGYTREYSYPGDGENYTLYLTEAMG